MAAGDLEELSPDRRDALLAALVTFGAEQPAARVVLGCEPDELERVARHGLQPAIASIVPLGPEEVGDYPRRLDGHAEALRKASARSQVLAEALRTPLALVAGVLAYAGRPVEQVRLAPTPEEQCQALVDASVTQALAREQDGVALQPEAAGVALGWLGARRREDRRVTVGVCINMARVWLPALEGRRA